MSFQGTLMPSQGLGEPRFIYRGEVVAIGGWLHANDRPEQHFRPFGRSLPYIGGEFDKTLEWDEVEGGLESWFKDVIGWKSIFYRISGKKVGERYETEVETRIHGLTIRNNVHLHVERIGWKLVSIDLGHAEKEERRAANRGIDTELRLEKLPGFDAFIEGTRVTSAEDETTPLGEIDPRFDETLINEPFKFPKVKDRKPVRRPGSAGDHGRGHAAGPATAGRPVQEGIALFSLVEDLQWSGHEASPDEIEEGRVPGGSRTNKADLAMNEIHVKGFGTLSFGEMVVTPADRRISMIHIRLGCARGGSLTLSSGGTDGHTYP